MGDFGLQIRNQERKIKCKVHLWSQGEEEGSEILNQAGRVRDQYNTDSQIHFASISRVGITN